MLVMRIEMIEPSFRTYLETRPIPASPKVETEVLMNRVMIEENADEEDRELLFARIIEACEELTTTTNPITMMYSSAYIILHRNPKEL